MTRKEFIKMCGIFGISIPFQTTLSACGKEELKQKFFGKVTIIGAGAGGLSAGYLLQQLGIDFEILEASPIYGGRMRINTDFADFPIPLGAEWLETNTSIFKEIVNDNSINVNVETYPDLPDRKFVNGSWFSFFENYIHPSISNKIVYNSIVQSIDYSGEQVLITTANGQYSCDKVIVAVPLKILQDGDISFLPTLPQTKQDAINDLDIWEGFKAFFEFSNQFYPDEYDFNISPSSAGQKIFYNASLGQNTSKHILGLFVVGQAVQAYNSLSENEIKNLILSELDGLFSNQATPSYIKHLSQNWNEEPFIKAGYLSDEADWKTVKKLGESVNNKVFFAGGPFTDGEDWVSVHLAAQSAKVAINEIVY